MPTAYIQTYDNLVLDVQRYMERDDAEFVAMIPTLIGLAESAIASELKLNPTPKQVLGGSVAGSAILVPNPDVE